MRLRQCFDLCSGLSGLLLLSKLQTCLPEGQLEGKHAMLQRSNRFVYAMFSVVQECMRCTLYSTSGAGYHIAFRLQVA